MDIFIIKRAIRIHNKTVTKIVTAGNRSVDIGKYRYFLYLDNLKLKECNGVFDIYRVAIKDLDTTKVFDPDFVATGYFTI